MSDEESGIDPDVRFVVTGATGWLGRSLLAWLAQALGPAWTRRVTAFSSQTKRLTVGADEIVTRPLPMLRPADVDGAVVMHFAFLGLERAADQAFLSSNMSIDDVLLNAFSVVSPRGVFVSSSGMARETASGANRNLYGAAKLVQEARFLSYAALRSARVLVGRVYNVSGPYINKLDNYALSVFLRQAMAGGPLQVTASTPVFRSFLHVFDLAALAVGEVLGDHRLPERPVDFCGAQVVEMQEVAMAAAAVFGLDGRSISRGPIDYHHRSSYVGDATDTGAMSLRKAVRLTAFEQQVSSTADYLLHLQDLR